ncbi:hypothetical protein BDZ91DRAFT_729660 [Kalaharituber pfeilii]|nr:hypothetical protein BDZ91DRAFT_729660 [Kalaharituber pfeilii]
MKSHQILILSIETPLLPPCLLRTSNSQAAQQTATIVCSFRVCCLYECSPFASRHLHLSQYRGCNLPQFSILKTLL